MVLDRFQDMAVPIVLNEEFSMSESLLNRNTYNSLEWVLGVAHDDDTHMYYQRLCREFTLYLVEKGVLVKGYNYQGIGKITKEQMKQRFGEAKNPKDITTFFTGRKNRKK